MRREARNFALQALYQWHMAGSTLNEIEAEFRAERDLSQVDIALFSELLHGIPAQVAELDQKITPCLDRTLDELDPIELNVLRIGTFELASRLSVPYRVAINESVNLAKTFGATDSHKYVNGVLDKLAKSLRSAEVNAARP
ncbi:transcription antitermination factor NusB [Motiliproteus sp. MSK22-1]|uniref:transcription antitermination factor NusB n=1 Tax=Motiliproteus sp. MSK22-1 TaxID=1897630 RepID=UPI0009F8A351|nr:transcription antitermination factor NusB [Motiliproteus sp. MSK22-1]